MTTQKSRTLKNVKKSQNFSLDGT